MRIMVVDDDAKVLQAQVISLNKLLVDRCPHRAAFIPSTTFSQLPDSKVRQRYIGYYSHVLAHLGGESVGIFDLEAEVRVDTDQFMQSGFVLGFPYNSNNNWDVDTNPNYELLKCVLNWLGDGLDILICDANLHRPKYTQHHSDPMYGVRLLEKIKRRKEWRLLFTARPAGKGVLGLGFRHPAFDRHALKEGANNLRAEVLRRLDELACMKPLSLPRRFASLFNSDFGDAIGHGFGRETPPSVDWIRSATAAVAADIKDADSELRGWRELSGWAALAGPLNRLSAISRSLADWSGIDAGETRTDIEVLADSGFNACFSGSGPVVPEHFKNLTMPSVDDFEDWRKCFKTYLWRTDPKHEKTLLKFLRKRLLQNFPSMRCDWGKCVDDVEVFVPHDWLFSWAEKLVENRQGSVFHSLADKDGEVEAVCLESFIRQSPDPTGSVKYAKAGIAFSCSELRPPGIVPEALRSIRETNALLHMYDLFLVDRRGGETVGVLEMKDDGSFVARTDGKIPIWPQCSLQAGHDLDLVQNGTSIVVVFETVCRRAQRANQ